MVSFDSISVRLIRREFSVVDETIHDYVCFKRLMVFFVILFYNANFIGQLAAFENVLEKTHVFERSIFAGRDANTHILRLKGVRSGTKQYVTILLENTSGGPVTFESVQMSCKCTTAKIPNVTVQPGEIEKVNFALDIPSAPVTLTESHSASIVTKGSCDLIYFRFVADLENVVTFGARSFVHVFSPDESTSSFQLKLLFSDIKLLKNAVIDKDESLSFITPQLVVNNGEASVKCDFDTNAVAESLILGEIRLKSNGQTIASVLGDFRKEVGIEILPSKMIFVPGETVDVIRQGTGVLRIRRSKSELETIEVRQIKCESPAGESLHTEYKKLGAGMYRLKVQAQKLSQLNSGGKLTWNITFNNGSVVEVESECSLSN